MIKYAEESGKKHIITSSIEHKAVLETVNSLKEDGFDVDIIDPEEDGRVDANKILALLRTDTLLVSLMHAIYERKEEIMVEVNEGDTSDYWLQ